MPRASTKATRRPGWWDNMIGPGKGIDTDKYFVVSSNVLGGCRGSTGPSSPNPKTGKPYGPDFPIVSIKDMVDAQRHLLDHLGIERLLSVTGGSMGGMQALQWMVSYPRRMRSAIPISTALKHTPQQIAFNEVGRQAIMADPNWREGDYYEHSPPSEGARGREDGGAHHLHERGVHGREVREAPEGVEADP